MHIDDKDADIIEALRRNPRASNVEIARIMGVSEGTIRRRLSRLLDEGAIEIRVASAECPTETPFGAIIEITVRPDSLDEVLERARALDETRFVASIAGGCDIIARIEVEDAASLNRILADRVRPIPGLERAETRIILNAAKDEGARENRAALGERGEERRERNEE